jgi:hypothetical protein
LEKGALAPKRRAAASAIVTARVFGRCALSPASFCRVDRRLFGVALGVKRVVSVCTNPMFVRASKLLETRVLLPDVRDAD